MHDVDDAKLSSATCATKKNAVVNMDVLQLREKLLKYKVALQPNKQPIIWRTLCETIENDFAGDIRKLFCDNDYSVQKVKLYIAKNKKKFPYLGGNKICNYWLYVMEQYTDVKFRLSPREATMLVDKAQQANMTESEYLRLMISQKPNDYPEIRILLRELINEVDHIGTNINQIVQNHNYGIKRWIDEEISVVTNGLLEFVAKI